MHCSISLAARTASDLTIFNLEVAKWRHFKDADWILPSVLVRKPLCGKELWLLRKATQFVYRRFNPLHQGRVWGRERDPAHEFLEGHCQSEVGYIGWAQWIYFGFLKASVTSTGQNIPIFKSTLQQLPNYTFYWGTSRSKEKLGQCFQINDLLGITGLLACTFCRCILHRCGAATSSA